MQVVSRKEIAAVFSQLHTMHEVHDKEMVLTPEAAQKFIDEIPDAFEWTPADTEFPEENEECYITLKADRKTTLHGLFTQNYGKERLEGFIVGARFIPYDEVAAWMYLYLPEPYQH